VPYGRPRNPARKRKRGAGHPDLRGGALQIYPDPSGPQVLRRGRDVASGGHGPGNAPRGLGVAFRCRFCRKGRLPTAWAMASVSPVSRTVPSPILRRAATAGTAPGRKASSEYSDPSKRPPQPTSISEAGPVAAAAVPGSTWRSRRNELGATSAGTRPPISKETLSPGSRTGVMPRDRDVPGTAQNRGKDGTAFGEVQTLATAPQGPICSPVLNPAEVHAIFHILIFSDA
jgi:hypothetical protein